MTNSSLSLSARARRQTDPISFAVLAGAGPRATRFGLLSLSVSLFAPLFVFDELWGPLPALLSPLRAPRRVSGWQDGGRPAGVNGTATSWALSTTHNFLMRGTLCAWGVAGLLW